MGCCPQAVLGQHAALCAVLVLVVLLAACQANNHNIKVIADIVVNHRWVVGWNRAVQHTAFCAVLVLIVLQATLRDRKSKEQRCCAPFSPAASYNRCATYQGEGGKWNKFGGRLAWDNTAICNNNPAWSGRGAHKTGDDYPAAPNIDHTQVRP
jgi:hypothetical protein